MFSLKLSVVFPIKFRATGFDGELDGFFPLGLASAAAAKAIFP
ncbi:hypothetical protein [Paenibacillus sp. PastM-2]|nr:hypothetical protein [Paenibacillus sp. PastM-2]MDF9850289.1 hypothetical protein [Paenibacillus sp. PastM-2]